LNNLCFSVACRGGAGECDGPGHPGGASNEKVF